MKNNLIKSVVYALLVAITLQFTGLYDILDEHYGSLGVWAVALLIWRWIELEIADIQRILK